MQPSHAASLPTVASPRPFEGVERVLVLLAPHDAPVLFVGEPGSGRSVLARRLHHLSSRRADPWQKVDCRSLAMRSGGAAALEDAIGSAGTGSILLEEVGLLTAPLQIRVMVWLERSRGSPRPRILATAQSDLEDEVERGTFREDLRSRIDVFEITVPPLRQRRAEIGALARHFLAESAARLRVPALDLPPDVERLLVGYGWPGNLRELRSAMERAVALSSGGAVEAVALPPRVLAGTR